MSQNGHIHGAADAARPAPRDIPVVILAGGMGTRLREETEKVPKPLVPIGGKPILWHIMKIYGHYGFRRFIVCLGYKSWLIKEFFIRYREQLSDFTIHMNGDGARGPVYHDSNGREDWEITFAETGLHTMTGGRLWKVRDYIDADTFMFTYGDGIGAVDIHALLEFHYEQGRTGTVTGVHPSSRYGEMKVNGTCALEFNEKPTVPEGFVSGGFFVFQRSFIERYMNDDPGLYFEHEPLRDLARDGELSVYKHEEFWMGMDTYREFMHLNELWEAGQAPWRVWDRASASPAAR
jgi:glucose-1-phosphate cytidylyltransferase